MNMKRGRGHTYVLGTGLSHDGSACLLKDGRICVAIEKERITRIKHDGGYDREAIDYCLAAEGIKIDDVDLLVQNANHGMFEYGNDWYYGQRNICHDSKIVTISHHLAHAYSTIGTSPFDNTAILVIDGCGNAFDNCIDLEGALVPERPPEDTKHLWFEKDSYYIYRDNELTPVFKDFSPWGLSFRDYPLHPNTTLHSIGGLYLGVSTYIFSGFEDPGKLMGLAPYGRPNTYNFPLFDLRDGRVFVRYDWIDRFNMPCRNYSQFKENFQYYADIAWWVQREIERAILYVIDSRYELAPSENLTYSGGVALNAVANRRVLKEGKFRRIYMQPAASDNGLAIGCAYYGWLKVLGREKIKHDGSAFLGMSYGESRISQALLTYNDRIVARKVVDPAREAAALLAEGKVIGWFQGGSEFGPRALGHRSILADSRNAQIRDHINSRIKFREDFRPFAPSVIFEEVGDYFDCDYESPYMILVAPVKEEWKDLISAVVHKDGSARIHTVTKFSDPQYYQLLKYFKGLTGISVILNTSFNKKGMPIVETPEQAIDLYLHTALDVLVLGDYVVEKAACTAEAAQDIGEIFKLNISRGLANNHALVKEIGGVYQILLRGLHSWTIDLSGGVPSVTEALPKTKPSVSVEISEEDFLKFYNDPEGEGMRLIASGKLKIEGKREDLWNLAKIIYLK
jgi:carbamoyltransferase